MHLKKIITEEWEIVACNQRIKAKQLEGLAKSKQKRETSSKDKALAILMVQPWQRVARQRITQSFSPNPKISFPPLKEEEGTESQMIIEAKPFHAPNVCGWHINFRNTIRALLLQTSLRNKKSDGSSHCLLNMF
nr:hypothetical protein [Tanacetum cinerariifolium]